MYRLGDLIALGGLLAVLGGLVAWNRLRPPGTAGLVVSIVLGLAVFVGLRVVRERLLFDRPSRPPAPLERAALAARADSICATVDDQRFADVRQDQASEVADRGGAYAQIDAQEARALSAVIPAPDVERDWRRVVAAIVAENRYVDALVHGDFAARPPPDRVAAKAARAARRLGIDCSSLSP